MCINYRNVHDVWGSTNFHDFSRPEKYFSVFHDREISGFLMFFQLTSNIILQLLQGPIWENTCRMRASVTSLERFPTYLKTQTTADWKTRSMRRVFPSSLTLAAHPSRFHFCHVFSAREPTANMIQKLYFWENPRIVNRLSVWFTILNQRKVWEGPCWGYNNI